MRSFEIDHTKLVPGVYYHSKSGVVTTWDIRIKFPNKGDYLSPRVIHTIEHTLAKYLRDAYGNYRIVGIFPMGCQTGFYVLTRFMSRHAIHGAIKDYIRNLQSTSNIPGYSEKECGNYKFHDLKDAKEEMLNYYDEVLRYSNKARNYTE